jgi:hypothetical protein
MCVSVVFLIAVTNLLADELNILVDFYPDFSPLKGIVVFDLKDKNMLEFYASIPLGQGTYFNARMATAPRRATKEDLAKQQATDPITDKLKQAWVVEIATIELIPVHKMSSESQNYKGMNDMRLLDLLVTI